MDKLSNEYPRGEFYSQINAYGDRIKKSGSKSIPYYINFAKAFDSVENRPFYLMDIKRHEFLFISPKYLRMLGYNPSTKLDYDFFIDNLHPGDFQASLDMPVLYLNFLDTISPSKRNSYKMISDLRLKLPDGKYIRINEQMTVLEFSEEGFPRLFLTICDLSQVKEVSSPPGALVIDVKNKKVIKTYGCYLKLLPQYILSQRELEILTYISKGFFKQANSCRIRNKYKHCE